MHALHIRYSSHNQEGRMRWFPVYIFFKRAQMATVDRKYGTNRQIKPPCFGAPPSIMKRASSGERVLRVVRCDLQLWGEEINHANDSGASERCGSRMQSSG